MRKYKTCGEAHEDNFDACWNCGTYKEGIGKNAEESLNSKQLYDIAYNLHYKERKPLEVLDVYQQIIYEFPNTDEAKLSSK